MNTLRLTLFLFIAQLIFGCSEKEPLSIKKVIVAGKIQNQEKYPDNYTIKVFENNLVNFMGNYHTSNIKDDGSFKIQFEKSFASDVYLIYGSTIILFVNPGDSVYIEVDANEVLNPNPESRYDFKSLKFSGSNQLLNNEIKLFLPFMYNNDAMEAYNNEKTLPAEDYLNYLEGKKVKQIHTLDSLIKTKVFSEKFDKWSRLLIPKLSD